MLKLAMPTQHIALDPHQYEDLYSMTIIRQIYRGLFAYSPDGRIVTDLVDRWETSEDKCTYTFHLKNAKFSDDSNIEAIHAETSLKRIFFKKSSLSSDLALIKGGESYLNGSSLAAIQISAQNNNTLIIRTAAPSSLLLYLLATPDAAILKVTDPRRPIHFSASTPYSGAYKIESVSNEQISLKKWRHSALDSPKPPQTISISLQKKINAEDVLSGALTDTSNFMTLDQINHSFEGSDSWRPVVSEATNERFIVINPKKVSKPLRSWMLAQVDQDKFVKQLGDSSIIPAYGFIPPFLPGAIKEQLITQNKELTLDKKVTIQVIYGENLPYREKFVSYLKSAWHHPLLDITFKAVPISVYLEKLFGKTGEVVIAAKGIDYPEGFAAVAYFRSNVDSNFLFVDNAAVDNLINVAGVETDQEKRANIYREIQRHVLDGATVIPLAFGAWKKYYWHKRVKYVPPHPLGVQFIPFEMIEL